ncbi:MAG: hypothetical protein L3J46_01555 [Kangiellaceae bacterium]|nr:hypothetical protein [Kangiellaceae bacterium]
MKPLLLLIMVIAVSSCATYQVPDSPPLEANQVWLLMPFENNSNRPLAAENAEQILAALLFAEGIKIHTYPKTKITDLKSILDSSSRDKHAKEWLSRKNGKYIISGSVDEWQYKSGLDGEPAVGVTLILRDRTSGEVLWRATGTRGGWGRESLSGTGQIVLQELIDGLDINENSD